MKKTINLDRILCPIVPSLGIDEGLECAVALARAHDAKLFVCYFVEDASMVAADVRTGVEETIKKSAARLFNSSPCSAATPLLDWEIIISESRRPAEAIVQEAKERNVDLIAMSSRHRPYAAALLGSTAETLSRTAPCPLLITRPGGGRFGNWREVLDLGGCSSLMTSRPIQS